jgi:hypothetical protein
MSSKRVNVLVYAGAGSTTSSVRHAVWSLRRLLGPNYAVLTVSGDQILKEPWMASCALLVMPGGADMGYARTLNGAGNRRIKQYVQMGGRYLGLCAGGYYGAARCEWEVGKKGMEVIGDRELAFYPGICRGLAFGGFEYQSEAGTSAAGLVAVLFLNACESTTMVEVSSLMPIASRTEVWRLWPDTQTNLLSKAAMRLWCTARLVKEEPCYRALIQSMFLYQYFSSSTSRAYNPQVLRYQSQSR